MKRNSLTILLVAGLICGGYLLASQFTAGPGFPLDDAWIHQTYARNLERYGQWAFTPGIPSAGSTAPLWSALLALGYLFGNHYFLWTYLCGALSLAGLALAGQTWSEKLSGRTTAIRWVGIFIAGEWHLVWSSLSGMETITYACLILLCFLFLQAQQSWIAGGTIALAVWLRPDAITLLGPALLVFVTTKEPLQRKAITLGKLMLPVIGSIFLYAFFNASLSGSVLPNTFFAKQAEYAVISKNPFIIRLFDIIRMPLIGSGLLLLPGFIFSVIDSIKQKNWMVISAVLWWIGYSLIYALRLPVTYQYGRYVIPSMPVFFVLGFVGTGKIFQWVMTSILSTSRSGSQYQLKFQPLLRILSKVWQATFVAVWFAFLVIGANQYRNDVGIIQTEMVAAATWVNNNTPADAKIAAHDIGAIGFFSYRPMIDLAGLVSPEVIPFIRDQSKLIQFLNGQRVSYLVTFPGWYPEIVSGRKILYKTDGKYAPAQDGENMAVYAWP